MITTTESLLCRWYGRAVPAPGNAFLPEGTSAPSAGPEPGGGRLLQEVPLLLAGQRQVSAPSEAGLWIWIRIRITLI
jgi:hypothetical protein